MNEKIRRYRHVIVMCALLGTFLGFQQSFARNREREEQRSTPAATPPPVGPSRPAHDSAEATPELPRRPQRFRPRERLVIRQRDVAHLAPAAGTRVTPAPGPL